MSIQPDHALGSQPPIDTDFGVDRSDLRLWRVGAGIAFLIGGLLFYRWETPAEARAEDRATQPATIEEVLEADVDAGAPPPQ